MNQQCKVCSEPAAGFHFGAFTCEGCKSFFGRTYNNLSQINECKNGGQCVINKQNRTSCKACRLRKCLLVGMSKSGSRYGRRSNWFKIHCALQEQAANLGRNLENSTAPMNIPHSSGQTTISMLPTANYHEESKNFMSDCKSPHHSISPNNNSIDEEIKKNWTTANSNVPKHFPLDQITKAQCDVNQVTGDRAEEGESLAPAARRAELVAGLSIYGLHSGLSLLQASQLYQQLYPSIFYANIPNPVVNNLQNKVPSIRSPSQSPEHQLPSPINPPSPCNSLPLPTSHRESLSNPPSPRSLPSRPLSSHPTPSPPLICKKRSAESAEEQDEPIDLSVKRTKFSHPTAMPLPDLTPLALPFNLFKFGLPPSTVPSVPVDLTTNA